MAANSARLQSGGLFNSRRGRAILQNLTAYAFLTPAGLLIFLFGLFPVAFAFFVSLHRWRRFPEGYRGLDQYVDALGNFAFVAFFWIAAGAMLFGLLALRRLWRETRENEVPRALAYLVPGAFVTGAVLAFVYWFFELLPVVLNVPQRIRNLERTRTLFINEFFASFRFPEVLDAADIMWLAVIAAVVVTVGFLRFVRVPGADHYLYVAVLGLLALAGGALLMQLTLSEIDAAIAAAQEAGESLPVWSQIILISLGVVLLVFAYMLWQRAGYTTNDRRFWVMGLAVVLLIVGGYLLVAEIPRALSEADDDVMQGFSVTVMYSLFSVPLQLVLGLGLAVLLFQNIKGKSLFRIIYFLPYITPFVATSVIFSLLFSQRGGSPANRFLNMFGIEPQTWLQEPTGVFELIFPEIPGFLSGPGLALIVIILFNVWVYAGYSTVIFLAGLGNIPGELYEAARIDGASGWAQFRFITFPLLSPTTFFLTLIATIGTFQAFTQIWLLRKAGAYDAVDTINVYIFEEVRAANPDYAYGSAMAFVLFGVILVLTLLQNRFAGRRVFYG